MNPTSILSTLAARSIAAWVRQAQSRVVYAAPGIHLQPAAALAELASRLPLSSITVSLDFDERTLRMGYGSLAAVEALRKAGIEPTHSPGFRSAVLIVDDAGWVFTPTALYLEAEPQSDETPNAIRLTSGQVQDLLLRLCPAARDEAIANARTPEEAARLSAIPLEVSEVPLGNAHFAAVKEAIEAAPPVNFDIIKQVRVFEPYLQYVDIKLTGAAIQKHKVAIPKVLQNLGASKDLEGRLRTTFDLIEKGGTLSSKALEDDLNDIRKCFTPSLGKDHGRVVLKSAKALLIQRLEKLREKLEAHQKRVEDELTQKLNDSKKQVVAYYLPLIRDNPPDALVGGLIQVTEENIRDWIEGALTSVFPSAEKLIHKMVLEEHFKDVTYETLNRPDFLASVKSAFPHINWDKAYDEFKAAGEPDQG